MSQNRVPFGTREVRAGPRFTDEHEARYFIYYCDGISKKIGGPFNSKLWAQLVPQAGEGTPFIGRAVIALGALSLSLSTSQERERHHRYALNQYVLALQGMRRSIKDHPYDVRTALIGCLLIFIFESLQGHQAAACSHASSGTNLITSMCRSRCAPKAWRESEIGEELYSAFSGLNLQSLLFEGGCTDDGFYKHGLSEAAKGMPESFDDLDECRRFWHYFMRRNLHFCREVASFYSRARSLDDADIQEVEKELKEERDGYVQQICRWEIASAPLLCRLFTSGEEGEAFLVACLLRIHAAMSIVLLSRAFNPPEMEYDRFCEQFRTTVELSERIHGLLVSGENEESGTFRFEIGILPALSLVTLLCRERALRGRAVKLLGRSKGYKEGIWNADAVRAVGEWVRGVEEDGLEDAENVSNEKRMSVLGCETRVEERRAKVRFRHADGVERDALVEW